MAMTDIENDELHTSEQTPVQKMTDYEMEGVFPSSTVIPSDQVSARALPPRGPITRGENVLPKSATANA